MAQVISSNAQIKRLPAYDGPTVSVLDFGADKTGVTPSTAAIQAAIDYVDSLGVPGSVLFPNGTYTSDSFFLFGDVSLAGESAAGSVLQTITTNLARPTGYTGDQARFINGGYKTFGATSAFPWKGTIENLTISGRVLLSELVHINRFENAIIRNCRLIGNGLQRARLLAVGYNDAAFLSGGTNIKRGMQVIDNYFDATPAEAYESAESIGFGDGCEYFTIARNIIENQTDDVGIHRCQHFTIEGNVITSYDGRIYLGSCHDAVIANNILRYTHATAAGMGIMLTVESASNSLPCTGVTITGNNVTYEAPNARYSAYGIRIMSGRNVVVANNVLTNDTSVDDYSIGSIHIDKEVVSGWTDSTGLDAANNPEIRNLVVSGNTFGGTNRGGIIVANADYTGPISVNGNVGGVLYLADTGNVINLANNTFESVELMQVGQKNGALRIPAARVLKTSANATLYTTMEFQDATTVWTAPFAGRLLSFDFFCDNFQSGFFQSQLYKNGATLGAVQTIVPVNGYANRQVASNSDQAYSFAAGDTLEVRIRSSNCVPTNPYEIRIGLIVFPFGRTEIIPENGFPTERPNSEFITAATATLSRTGVSILNSASNAIAATLPNGLVIGERKLVVMNNATNSSTLTVTTHETSNPEVFTFNALTSMALFEWSGSTWHTIKATAGV